MCVCVCIYLSICLSISVRIVVSLFVLTHYKDEAYVLADRIAVCYIHIYTYICIYTYVCAYLSIYLSIYLYINACSCSPRTTWTRPTC